MPFAGSLVSCNAQHEMRARLEGRKGSWPVNCCARLLFKERELTPLAAVVSHPSLKKVSAKDKPCNAHMQSGFSVTWPEVTAVPAHMDGSPSFPAMVPSAPQLSPCAPANVFPKWALSSSYL